MKNKYGIILFAVIEIVIGVVTLAAVILSIAQARSNKPLEVIIFVLVTASISMILGFGILRQSSTSYYLLLYFSSVIILSKILIFARIINLSGALETSIPSHLKNLISVFYHGLLILYFMRPSIRDIFVKYSA